MFFVFQTGHIGDIHRVVNQADARGSTTLRGTGPCEDCQVCGPWYHRNNTHPVSQENAGNTHTKNSVKKKLGKSHVSLSLLDFFLKQNEFDEGCLFATRLCGVSLLLGETSPWCPRCRRAVFSGSVAEVAL